MNSASKILTVSYGTFSCTLEGFDDPFNTMKAIAEYFRDLAAEDRYFGAEPPTPDAAMLHRIAEREIQRRVEAKIQENGVVLRASDEVAAPAVAAPLAVPVAEPAAAQAPTPAVVPSVAPVAAPATESVVEKLSRLRNEVAAQPAPAAPVATVPFVSFAIPDYLEDHEALDMAPVADIPAAEFLPEAEAPATIEAGEAPLPEDLPPASLPDAAPAAVADEVADILPESDAGASEAETAVEAEAETLRAILREAEPETEEEPVVSEAEPVPAPEAELPDVLAEVETDPVISPPAALADAVAAEEADAPSIAEDAEEELAEAASSQPDDAVVTAVSAASPVLDEAEEDALLSETLAAALADPEVIVAEPAPVAPPAEPVDEEADEEPPAPAGRNLGIAAIFGTDVVDTPQDQPEGTFAQAPELRPAVAEKLQRARARVIRIRRGEDSAEAEATPAAAPVNTPDAAAPAPMPDAPDASIATIFAEVEEEVPAAPARSETAKADDLRALLSAEDEAELQRELAALRSLTEDSAGAEEEDKEEGKYEDEDEDEDSQSDARRAFQTGPSADEAMGRLMEQTDTEMQGPETKRRQSAIAHLKAAVAATVADRKVAGEPTEEKAVSRLARYRNDLAMVVKSALPGTKTEEGKPAERPAPLVLVSEQRIDRPRPAPVPTPSAPAAAVSSSAPVRPRRVSSSGLAMQEAFYEEEGEEDVANLFGETKGFADFVERVGATTLEEILEASAAFMSVVEGRDHFSRPQLMWHVNTVVPQGTYQREDGLRSFGTLLRNGRISKLRRGAFVLSDESAYLAEAKKIAG